MSDESGLAMMVERLEAERDAALARAEAAERERDEAREEATQDRNKLADSRDAARARVAALEGALRELLRAGTDGRGWRDADAAARRALAGEPGKETP